MFTFEIQWLQYFRFKGSHLKYNGYIWNQREDLLERREAGGRAVQHAQHELRRALLHRRHILPFQPIL